MLAISNWQKIRSQNKHCHNPKKKRALSRPAGENQKNKKKSKTLLKKDAGEAEKHSNERAESKEKDQEDLSIDTVHQKILASRGHSRLHEGGASLSGVLALDCEMVGVGPDGKRDALARVSIVNFEGDVVYDSYVKAGERVQDYRTNFSGITSSHLMHAPTFEEVQKKVAEIIKGRVLVVHSGRSDLHVLMLTHEHRLIRDTARYRTLCPKAPRRLADLCLEHLNLEIQKGSHDSVEDARATLCLYRAYSKAWEKSAAARSRKRKQKTFKKAKTATAASS